MWWVFRVDRHRPANRLSLVEAAPRIGTAIESTREQTAIERMFAYLARRYRARTVCRETYAPECGNAPHRD
jgi:hypothetical protein